VIKIRNILLISLPVLLVILAICFFIFDAGDFYAIAAGGALTFLLFVLTLMLYFKASRESSRARLSYVVLNFVLKIFISALFFYLVYRFKFVNIMTYLISFVVFFTVFFNVEIFLIYKKVLFSEK
jgi:hypothetical protein